MDSDINHIPEVNFLLYLEYERNTRLFKVAISLITSSKNIIIVERK